MWLRHRFSSGAAILRRNLVPRCPAADLFGRKGRGYLAEQALPADERQALAALLRQLDFHGQELRIVDAELGRVARASVGVKRLMTIPGVDATVALSVVAAVGDFARFGTPERLVSDLGLNPRVKQSGGQPAAHGRGAASGRSATAAGRRSPDHVTVLLAQHLEWSPFRGHVRALAVRPRKDGVRRAPNPTCVPGGVPA